MSVIFVCCVSEFEFSIAQGTTDYLPLLRLTLPLCRSSELVFSIEYQGVVVWYLPIRDHTTQRRPPWTLSTWSLISLTIRCLAIPTLR